MTDAKNRIWKRTLFWGAWVIASPVILFFVINSPIGLGLIWVAWGGGGIFLVIAFIVYILTGGVVGARSSSEGNGFAQGVLFVLIPFVTLFLLVGVNENFSESSRRNREEEKARKIMSEQPPILTNGLYVESISLKWAYGAMLADRQIPFIEGDVVNDKWLFDLSKDKQSYGSKSIGKKYYRLALGPSDSLDCISLENENDNPARRARVIPKPCLTLVFDNARLSDTRLHLNLEQMKFRNEHLNRFFGEAYLEVLRNDDTKPIISIPFWPGSNTRDPKDFSPAYNETSSWMYGSFPDLMRKLSPRTTN